MYRRLGPDDAAAVARHYLSLCPRDRSRRFGVAKSDEAVARYCAAIDWDRARLIGYFVRGRLCGLIELSAPIPGWAHAREAAIAVAHGWRRRGIGRCLVRMAAATALGETCDRIVFFWERGNDAAALFVASCGGVLDHRAARAASTFSRAAARRSHAACGLRLPLPASPASCELPHRHKQAGVRTTCASPVGVLVKGNA